ncbi:MAG: hypothetical protein ACRDL7_08995 [Gaiellaceae bacterium]
MKVDVLVFFDGSEVVEIWCHVGGCTAVGQPIVVVDVSEEAQPTEFQSFMELVEQLTTQEARPTAAACCF